MFTKENAHEMQARGVMKRMLFQTPERRSMVARRAALMRWYNPTGDDLERIECFLRFFHRQVAQAILEENPDRAIRAAGIMLGFERQKIALRAGRMRDVTPELSDGLEKKLAAARERREKALVSEEAPVAGTDTTATHLTTSDTK